MNDVALTVRVGPDLAQRLRIQKALTGESTNCLVNRLLADYLAGSGREAAVAAATDRIGTQYAVALDKLA